MESQPKGRAHRLVRLVCMTGCFQALDTRQGTATWRPALAATHCTPGEHWRGPSSGPVGQRVGPRRQPQEFWGPPRPAALHDSPKHRARREHVHTEPSSRVKKPGPSPALGLSIAPRPEASRKGWRHHPQEYRRSCLTDRQQTEPNTA